MISMVVLSSTERAKCSPMDKNVDDLKSLEDQSRGSYESLDIYLSWIILLYYVNFSCIISIISQLKSWSSRFASLGDNSGWIDGKICSYTVEPDQDSTKNLPTHVIQYCYLSTNEECDGGKKIIDYWPCHLYTKQWDEIHDRKIWFLFNASILNASQYWKV